MLPDGLTAASLAPERFSRDAPSFDRIGFSALGDLASRLAGTTHMVGPRSAVLQLTAQQPYDPAAGNVDVVGPGRWDTSLNLIFMEPIKRVGPPGEWEGSVAYVTFKPPAPGRFLVVGNFTGYQTTMHLGGPWGEQTAFTAETSDSGAVVALWTGEQPAEFTLMCTAPGGAMGYIESIQVFGLA